MKIRLITIGKLKFKPHGEIAADYAKRLGHYLPFEFISVNEEADFLKRMGSDEHIVVCDERGREMVTAEFSAFIEEHQIRSTKYLTFAIGPAEGFSDLVRTKADTILSLSRFTMQHDLAMLVLLEQVYRAITIIRGEPYHK